MVGAIRRPNPMIPFDPTSIFDLNNTTTEELFIILLNRGIYDSSIVGKFVTLSNSVDYNNGKYVIADVNHDSANTGQTGCYDLISVNCFHYAAFGSSKQWRSSSLRTWLNNTFYLGFSSNFQIHIMNIKYKSLSYWYEDDKIIIPSYKEVNGGTSGYTAEGASYPIFTNDSSRLKYEPGLTYGSSWPTRTPLTSASDDYIWIVGSDGSMLDYGNYTVARPNVPLLRVS